MASKYCEPYQKGIEREWFALRRVSFMMGNTQCFKTNILVSKKGQKQIVKLLMSENSMTNIQKIPLRDVS